jgi:hypothetical protein
MARIASEKMVALRRSRSSDGLAFVNFWVAADSIAYAKVNEYEDIPEV